VCPETREGGTTTMVTGRVRCKSTVAIAQLLAMAVEPELKKDVDWMSSAWEPVMADRQW